MTHSIFEPDELKIRRVNPGWTRKTLLEQEGIFYLNAVARSLKMSTVAIKQRAKALRKDGKTSWEEMGVQEILGNWFVRMKTFRHYLSRERVPFVQTLDPHWDANEALAAPGIFFLIEICAYIPFTPNQIRYQAHRVGDSRQVIGVWKDPFLETFLVENPTFQTWIKKLWLEGFHDTDKPR